MKGWMFIENPMTFVPGKAFLSSSTCLIDSPPVDDHPPEYGGLEADP
jgi:hypothetical protein